MRRQPRRCILVSIASASGSATCDVLDGLDFERPRGEFVVLVGPSGCGKSTLLNLCSGWLTPTRGRVDGRAQPHDLPAGRPVPVADRRENIAPRVCGT